MIDDLVKLELLLATYIEHNISQSSKSLHHSWSVVHVSWFVILCFARIILIGSGANLYI